MYRNASPDFSDHKPYFICVQNVKFFIMSFEKYINKLNVLFKMYCQINGDKIKSSIAHISNGIFQKTNA